MKVLVLATILLATTALGQTPAASMPATPPNPKDVSSLDGILYAVYDVISGPAGKRDWDRMRSLFVPGAQLSQAYRNQKGEIKFYGGDLDNYIKLSGPYFEKKGFFEHETHRHTDTYANITQVFSTYESRYAKDDKKPFERGVNSFQLMNDGKRWWIVSIYWQGEDAQAPLPKKWLH